MAKDRAKDAKMANEVVIHFYYIFLNETEWTNVLYNVSIIIIIIIIFV